MTADDLLKLPSIDCRFELIAGQLKTLPFRTWHRGLISNTLTVLLGQFIRRNRLGRVFAAGTGFLLKCDPDTVRAPDFAFIAREHLPATDPKEAFLPGAPDLAIEVLSPGDTLREVNEKIEDWLAAVCAAVWVVDPKLQTVTIYQSPTNIQVRAAGEILTGDPVVPGFSCAVDELFR